MVFLLKFIVMHLLLGCYVFVLPHLSSCYKSSLIIVIAKNMFLFTYLYKKYYFCSVAWSRL